MRKMHIFNTRKTTENIENYLIIYIITCIWTHTFFVNGWLALEMTASS